MYAKNFLVAAVLSSVVRATSCPSAWSNVGFKLKDTFGECNSLARQAIRLPFHDCFPGACDGSIILSDECNTRDENTQLRQICSTLGSMAKEFKVGVADLIQVAAAVAVVTCPPSPTIKVRIGRKDSSKAEPTGQIPPASDTATQLVALFKSKGFTVEDLVALVGSHSAAVNRQNQPLDSTVDSLDSPTYYGEVANGTAPAILPSDRSLATDNVTKGDWQEYVHSQELWDQHFATAMEKMAVMGVDNNNLVDCTSTVFGSDFDRFW